MGRKKPYIFDDRINEVFEGDKVFFHEPSSRKWFYGTVCSLDEDHNTACLVDDATGYEATLSGRYIRLHPSDKNGFEIEEGSVVFLDEGRAYEVIGYCILDDLPALRAWDLSEGCSDDVVEIVARDVFQLNR